MKKWNKEQAFSWYENLDWIVGCNYLPSNAINQLEMFQVETYDKEINLKELSWAKDLGFNSVRVYLHDLLWNESEVFKKNLNIPIQDLKFRLSSITIHCLSNSLIIKRLKVLPEKETWF